MGTSRQIAVDDALERVFERKRSSFLDDYELQSKPALIWQARPSDELALDISDEKLRAALSAGGGPASNDGWWRGFKMNWRHSLVFDGVASVSDYGSAGWVTELHVDGHLMAGVWTFPELGPTSAKPGPGVADFYVDAFRDFAYLASNTYEAAGYATVVQMTCTMHHADRLPLLGNHDRVLAPAPKRQTLRWPIANVKAAEMSQAGTAMATQFMRAYGRTGPRT